MIIHIRYFTLFIHKHKKKKKKREALRSCNDYDFESIFGTFALHDVLYCLLSYIVELTRKVLLIVYSIALNTRAYMYIALIMTYKSHNNNYNRCPNLNIIFICVMMVDMNVLQHATLIYADNIAFKASKLSRTLFMFQLLKLLNTILISK